MGIRLPHDMLINYNVDEVIETLPFSSNVNLEMVTKNLMRRAPNAYTGSGVALETIWYYLPTYTQYLINAAADRMYRTELETEVL